MYAEHFHLKSEPFSLTPDPAYLYLGPAHREPLAAVKYGLLDGRGFITLIGEVGTGKTTLLYSLLSTPDADIDAAYVSYSAQTFEDLLATALKDFEVEVLDRSKAGLLEALNEHLLRRADDGRITALVIDEAQNLGDDTFEELRLLSNFETFERKLLQVVLVGQPELQDRLRQPRLRQLRERVAVRAHVNPLSREEMMRYIEHRLARVGGTARELFSPRALRAIVRRTEGIPRRANILCHNALLFAYGGGLSRVTADVAREAIAEMNERRPGLFGGAALRRRSRFPRRRWAAAAAAAGAALALGASRWWPSLPGSGVVEPAAATAVEAASAARAPAAGSEDAAPAATPVAARQESTTPVVVPTDAGTEPPETPEVEAATAEIPAVPPAAPIEADILSVIVPRGQAVWHLMRDVYGREALEARYGELLRAVHRLNPDVRDLNMIIAGATIRLPKLADQEGR